MKKKAVLLVTSLALVVVLLMGLCACGSTWGSIRKAYAKEGYEEAEISDTYKQQAEEFVGKDYADKITIHILQKKSDKDAGLLEQMGNALSVVVVAEFAKNDDLVDSLSKKYGKENVENVYDELQKLDNVNGNCVLVLSTIPQDAKLFKS